MENNSPQNSIYKPSYKAFFWYHLLKMFGIFGVILLILGIVAVVSTVVEFMIVLGLVFVFVFLPSVVVTAVVRHIQYTKEEYEVTADSVIARSGSIFSNNEVELSIKNITDVERIYPWIESMILGTGNIKIESAGSSTTEVLLQSVDNAQEITAEIEQIMTDYGFDLSTDELIYQTKPSAVGIVIDTIGFVVSLIFGGFATLLYILFQIEDPEVFDSTLAFATSSGVIAVLIFVFVIVAILAALRAADLRQRVYSVFSGVIRYEEGFLTKHYAVIPTQNLSDANVQQDIFRRLFGISNVVLSTRGTQNQIKFANIPNAREMEEVIDSVIKGQTKHLEKLTTQKQAAKLAEFKDMSEEHKANLSAAEQRQMTKLEAKHSKRKVRAYSEFTGEFRRSLAYLLISPLIGLGIFLVFAVVIGLIIMAATQDVTAGFTTIIGLSLPMIGVSAIGLVFTYVQHLISYYAVKYQIRENSIYEEFSFLSRNTREFTLDKVTAIKFHRGFIQRFFGVCNVNFYSIGSAQNIVMRDVPYSTELADNLLNKLGVKVAKSDHDATFTPQFNIKDWALRSIVPVGLIGLIVVPLVILVVSLGLSQGLNVSWLIVFSLLMFVYLAIMAVGIGFHWWYQTTVKLDIYDEHLAFSGGILNLVDHYAALEYVKNTHSIKYPFTSTGTLKFDVAGAHYYQQDPAVRAQQQQQQNQFAQFGNTHQYNQASFIGNNNMISISYIPNVFAEHDQTDIYVAEEEGLTKSTDIQDSHNQQMLQDILITAKPSMWQAGLPLILTLAITGAGVILVPFVLPIILWYTSTMTYTLDGFRVSFLRGIFYKHKTTIINAQIDHIEKSQNLMNKLFSTGNVQINTEGGQGVEMHIINLTKYNDFYQKVKQEYM